MEPERSLARITKADIGNIYNGMVGLVVVFDYEENATQGLGSYQLDAAFVVRFMQAIGVSHLSKAVGRSCWVVHTRDKVLAVEPLHKKDGTPFVIAEWGEWLKARYGDNGPSYHELCTGKRPPHYNDER
jgi:hypothetical protein